MHAATEEAAQHLKKIIMDATEELMERMDAYLEERMSHQELVAFEADLKENQALLRLFEQHKEAILTVEAAAVRDRISNLIEAKRTEKKSRTINLNRNIIAIAASILILAGFFYFIAPSSPTHEGAIYQSFYQTDPGLPTLMGTSDNPIFTEAMVQFKEGKYSEALETFQVLTIANPEK